ncbi:cytochrome P450 [Mycena galopus ATCC 62051]|nr:cytochrome P450 [Mycena galopus ATCC 62051]
MNYSSLLALAILVLWFFQKLLRQRQLPFPPGPTPRFLVGNFRDLPTKLPWLTYTKWGLQYDSDLVHASTLGQHVVVVNSVKTAVELFEKRSHIYSDRPVVTMIELMGWDFNLGLQPLGDRWRVQRRMFQQHFRRDVSRNYRPIQIKKVHQLLRGLLSSPQEFREQLKTLTVAAIMSTIYGYEVKPSNDRFVAISEDAVRKLSESFFPGAVAVNTFPILRYLPSWMPGTGFKRFAVECRQLTEEMRRVPFDFVKRNMHDGVETNAVVARLLEVDRYDEVAIQEIAATAYAAGADTTVSALASFFLAMAVHPDIQKRAQTEIDTIIGAHRLPEFEDRPSLPFVEALFREVMRWKPVLPLGVSHASTADDIYNGYFIPKGATVISNIWAMTRDESIYPDPERFNPDRFLTLDGKLNDDDTVLAFGFGRRICVGRHNADAIIWATFASVLSTFNIAKAKDAAGNEIDIDPTYSDGLVRLTTINSHPQPFACSITPRSDTASNLVQATQGNDDL